MTTAKIVLGDDITLICDLFEENGDAVVLDENADTVQLVLTRTDGSGMLTDIFACDPDNSGSNWAAGRVSVDLASADTIDLKVAKLDIEVQVEESTGDKTSYFTEAPLHTKKGLIP